MAEAAVRAATVTGGRREVAKRERVDRILRAALDLLREGPPSGVTVERIAERAQVAPQTVFNLVGPRERIWAGLADKILGGLDFHSIPVDDPHERAHAIVDEVMRTITLEGALFRTLLADWSHSAPALRLVPAAPMLACFKDAVALDVLDPGVDVDRLSDLVTAGLLGHAHMWAAGGCDARSLRARARDQVDLAFAAAKPGQVGGGSVRFSTTP